MTKLDQLTECGVTVREATEDDDDDFGVIIPGKWYWFEDGNWCGPFSDATSATNDAAEKFL